MSNVLESSVSAPSSGPPSAADDIPSPTLTHYEQLAADFLKGFDELVAKLPSVEVRHPITLKFVRGKSNVKRAFLVSAVSAVEQSPELQGVNKLDVAKARDTLQYMEAFRTVQDKLFAFGNALKFTIEAKHAALANDALQIYNIAKGVNRDPGSPIVGQHVLNMERDLGRKKKGKKAPAPPPAPKPNAVNSGDVAALAA